MTKPEQSIDDLIAQLPDDLPVNLPEIIERIEAHYIAKAWAEHRSSRQIGEALGISHTTVINKMRKLEKE